MKSVKIPLGFWVLGIVLIAIGLNLGIRGYLDPAKAYAILDPSQPGVLNLARFRAARDIAMACTLIAAFWSRRAPALALAFFMRCLTECQDLVSTIAGGIMPALVAIPVFLLLFIAPEIWAVIYFAARSKDQ